MRVLYIVGLLFSASIGLAQSVDYDRIVVPEHITSADLEEKLVQLAWNNYPANRIAELEEGRAENQLNKANWDWLNRVTISGNLNEFTINPESSNRAQFYPRYNFNLTLPLGVFVDQANNSKISRANLAIEMEQIKQLKLSVRTQVLTRYEDFVRTKEILKRKGDYKRELDRRLMDPNDESGKKKSQQEIDRLKDMIEQSSQDIVMWTSSLKLAKLRVEEFIGVKLEEVIVP